MIVTGQQLAGRYKTDTNPVKGFKSYVKDVAGGAKVVGEAVKKGVKSFIEPSVEYKKSQKAKDDMYKQEGEMSNKEFSGPPSFKYGYKAKK